MKTGTQFPFSCHQGETGKSMVSQPRGFRDLGPVSDGNGTHTQSYGAYIMLSPWLQNKNVLIKCNITYIPQTIKLSEWSQSGHTQATTTHIKKLSITGSPEVPTFPSGQHHHFPLQMYTVLLTSSITDLFASLTFM